MASDYVKMASDRIGWEVAVDSSSRAISVLRPLPDLRPRVWGGKRFSDGGRGRPIGEA